MSLTHLDRSARRGATALLAALVIAACSGGSLPPASSIAPSTDASATSQSDRESASASASDSTSESVVAASVEADVVVDAVGVGTPIDRRVYGTNVPAWLGRDRFGDAEFQRLTLESGATVIRMPGGSWSNTYDWLACERGEQDCSATWAAKPSDFIDLMTDIALPGMWTVSINETAQQAAAAVAFFNGAVDDPTPIGVDRDGVDWGTVATWATMRADGGRPEPTPIQMWEVGNEVYGGKSGPGLADCQDFGWEDVWTCDGTEYVEGDADHDGYRAIRAAMLAVDPTISVGAVGVADPADWTDWGNEVIESAGADLDFYVVHEYGYDTSPDPQEALLKPQEQWPARLSNLRAALPDDVPIAITEYNLVAFEAGDVDDMMERVANALYIADTIGQFVIGGVDIANHWVIANGTDPEGTTYGLFNATDYALAPQYDAMATWAAMGPTLLGTRLSPSLDMPGVRVYSTRRDDGSLVLMLLNLGPGPQSLTVALEGVDPSEVRSATITSLRAQALDDREFVREPPLVVDDFDEFGQRIDVPAWSMSTIEIPAA